MKTQIRAKLGQQQKVSMQLQQAIKLMNMPALELLAHVQAILDENPVLEQENSDDTFTAKQNDKQNYNDNTDWLAQVQNTISLQDHLREQCALLPFSKQANEIAQVIIDSIDETGYLQTELGALFENMEQPEINFFVNSILHQIQQCEPAGVAARNLSECLLLQLPHIQIDDHLLQIINQIIHRYMKPLAQNNIELLAEKLEKPAEEIKQAIKIIKQLNPKPGLQIGGNTASSIIPDLSIKVKNGEIKITLNEHTPNLKVNANLQANFSQEHIKSAKDFIYQLHLRNQTLLEVAKSIVKHQRDFFHHGSAALKPLTLETIAKDTQLHISTLSRMTQQKYVHTPFGVCALKYFFNTAVAQSDNEVDIANTVIQETIRDLIDAEDSSQPLSDSQLVSLLAEKGIAIARRTVAKYRDQMNIPSSALRKNLE